MSGLLDHLPALQVVLPLISAPLIVLVRRQRFAMPVSFRYIAGFSRECASP